MNELPNIDFNDRHNTAQLQLTDSFRLNKQLQKKMVDVYFVCDIKISIIHVNFPVLFVSLMVRLPREQLHSLLQI